MEVLTMTGYPLATAYNQYDEKTLYWTDGKVVYHRLNSMKSADTESFRHYPGAWGIDKKHCYSQSTRLKTADPLSFEVLNDTFAKDKNHVWTLAGLIPEADADSFQVCDNGRLSLGVMLRPLPYGGTTPYETFVPYGYAKDKSHVYYYDFQGKTKIVKKADPLTFRSLQDGYFGIDNNYVFSGSHVIPQANPSSWHKLDEKYYYSRDRQRVYYFNRLIKEADAKTFRIIKEKIRAGKPRQLARDRNTGYWNDARIPLEQVILVENNQSVV